MHTVIIRQVIAERPPQQCQEEKMKKNSCEAKGQYKVNINFVI